MTYSTSTAAVIGDGVEVRESTIPGANRGLFTTRKFAALDIITEYTGRRIDRLEAALLYLDLEHWWVRSVDKQHAYIDGIREPHPGAGAASFANDARDEPNNARFVEIYDFEQCRTRVFLQAVHDLDADEEVFASYDSNFWMEWEQHSGYLTRTVKVQLLAHRLGKVSEEARRHWHARELLKAAKGPGPPTGRPRCNLDPPPQAEAAAEGRRGKRTRQQERQAAAAAEVKLLVDAAKGSTWALEALGITQAQAQARIGQPPASGAVRRPLPPPQQQQLKRARTAAAGSSSAAGAAADAVEEHVFKDKATRGRLKRCMYQLLKVRPPTGSQVLHSRLLKQLKKQQQLLRQKADALEPGSKRRQVCTSPRAVTLADLKQREQA